MRRGARGRRAECGQVNGLRAQFGCGDAMGGRADPAGAAEVIRAAHQVAAWRFELRRRWEREQEAKVAALVASLRRVA